MANHELGITTGNVVFGAPTLTVNPPAKPEEKQDEQKKEATQKTETGDTADDNSSDQDEGKL